MHPKAMCANCKHYYFSRKHDEDEYRCRVTEDIVYDDKECCKHHERNEVMYVNGHPVGFMPETEGRPWRDERKKVCRNI